MAFFKKSQMATFSLVNERYCDLFWWEEINDVWSYDLTPILEAALKVPPTKRNILSVLSSIYDHVGHIQLLPVTLKLFFQELCKLKFIWDDELPLRIVFGL